MISGTRIFTPDRSPSAPIGFFENRMRGCVGAAARMRRPCSLRSFSAIAVYVGLSRNFCMWSASRNVKPQARIA